MTTATEIITGALTAIGVHAPGESLDAALANDALLMLNDMLDLASNDDFMVVSINEIIANIAGKTDWTIGAGGDINEVRPLTINSAFVRIATLDYNVSVISVEEWRRIGLKQMNSSWPTMVYYNSGSPLGTLHFWPLPSQGEIHLLCDQLFTRFATLTDNIQFTPGYTMWMKWGLAWLLMPGYGKTDAALRSMVQQNRDAAVASIKSTNMMPLQRMRFDRALSGNRGYDAGWIMHGGFLDNNT